MKIALIVLLGGVSLHILDDVVIFLIILMLLIYTKKMANPVSISWE